MGNSSAERAAQSRSPGAGVARQGAARARWRAIMLAGDRAATEYRGRAEARLGRWREPLHASRGRGGRGRGGRGSGGGRAQRRGAPALALGGGRGRALHGFTHTCLTRSGRRAQICREKRRFSRKRTTPAPKSHSDAVHTKTQPRTQDAVHTKTQPRQDAQAQTVEKGRDSIDSQKSALGPRANAMRRCSQPCSSEENTSSGAVRWSEREIFSNTKQL